MPRPTPQIHRPPPGPILDPPPLFPPSLERLAFYTDWRKSWTHIVAGKFTTSPYDALLFYEQSTGYGEFYGTDGNGGIQFLQGHSGWRSSWTHIVPGVFHNPGRTGLLFYDQEAGFAAIYDTDGNGDLVYPPREYSGWRSSWTHITTVRIPQSDYSAVVLYDQAAGRGEIHRCNGSGELQLIKANDGWRTSWTHVVGGFRSGSGLLFYEAPTLHCEVYLISDDGDSSSLGKQAILDDMPPATDIIPGNFGWVDTNFIFYDRATGRASFIFYDPPPDNVPTGTIRLGEETYSDWRTSWGIIVPGNFWEPDPEYPKFQNGFTDLLFYDRAAGYGEFFLHEPFGSIEVHDLEGYVFPGSVAPGETINLYVNSRVGPYTINIYRQDVDEVLMTNIQNIQQFPQPFPIGRLDYRDGPAWPPVAEIVIPQNWPSGLYLARAEAPGNSNPATIPFVVRASVPGTQSTILLYVPDATYEAYNQWGGRSLYGCRSDGFYVWSYGPSLDPFPKHQIPRSFRVSFQRPYDVDGGATWPKWQQWEVPLIRWLALQGIAVELCTATDIHKDQANHSGLLSNYRLLVSVGHDEYWSKETRDNVENFASAGGNVVFFSGNVCWFQIRYDLNVNRVICYKDQNFDPYKETHPGLTTVRWFDTPVCRAETAMTGVSWYNAHDGLPEYHILDPGHWAFEGVTSEFFGLYTLPDDETLHTILNCEKDHFQPLHTGNCPLPSSPANFHCLAEVPSVAGGEVAGTMGIFTKGKGQVLTVGTIDWSLGLSQDRDRWNDIDQITLNIFNNLQ